MKEVYQFSPSKYYMFESLSSGRSCYFESEQEIKLFRQLFDRYVSPYVRVHRMFLGSEGYQVLLKIRESKTLRSKYKGTCEKKGKKARKEYMESPWRIVSEQMRILLSVYVKSVNKIRDRQGVLVQRRYKRYVFEDKTEYDQYIEQMDTKDPIRSQRNERYRIEEVWKNLVDWGKVRGKMKGESSYLKMFPDYVVSNLILKTKSFHSPPP